MRLATSEAACQAAKFFVPNCSVQLSHCNLGNHLIAKKPLFSKMRAIDMKMLKEVG